MSTIISIYVFGTVLLFLVALMQWYLSVSDFKFKTLCARLVLLSPVWPILFIYGLFLMFRAIIKDAVGAK